MGQAVIKFMNLYKISQTENRFHDTYDSAVVCAESEDVARSMNPASKDRDYSWTSPDNVVVELIGKAAPGIQQGVVVASFNAG